MFSYVCFVNIFDDLKHDSQLSWLWAPMDRSTEAPCPWKNADPAALAEVLVAGDAKG